MTENSHNWVIRPIALNIHMIKQKKRQQQKPKKKNTTNIPPPKKTTTKTPQTNHKTEM